MTHDRFYRHQRAWRDFQTFLPERLRLDVHDEPEEAHWEWEGHRVHIDRYRSTLSRVRIVLHHGVGTNGRQLSLILGAPLAELGYDVSSIDNLGFGMTGVRPGAEFTYDDWVRMVVAFLAHARAGDDRPIVLFGHSAGGMLAYHVAAAAPAGTLAGIGGTAFLDQRVRAVRDATAHGPVTSRIAAPAMGVLTRTRLAGVRYPMTLASKMSALVNDKAALKILRDDPTSAGNAMSLRFLRSYLTYAPAVEPEHFDVCPVLHAQPDADRWAPARLSLAFLSRLHRVAVTEAYLDDAGHLPLGDPGLRQLLDAVHGFARRASP